MIAFDLTEGNRDNLPPVPGLIKPLPKAKSLLGDTAYDGDAFHQFLADRGTTAQIKHNPTRKRLHPFDSIAYRGRNVIERKSRAPPRQDSLRSG
jgi:transposase